MVVLLFKLPTRYVFETLLPSILGSYLNIIWQDQSSLDPGLRLLQSVLQGRPHDKAAVQLE